jgi:glyceraldehyde-3-phosphate dehydrogenase (NAD(P))
MIEVGINGYGTIGKRVADAVREQPDMRVRGVAKTRPNHEAETARERGFPLHAAVPERRDQFDEAGIEVAGPVDDLVADSDVIVDATPSGVGAENRPLYAAHDTPALFQGGEDAGVADVSFNARANYADAVGVDFVRVVSCNTTGLSRLIAPLRERYGVQKVRVTLVRRGGDPAQSGRGPINDVLPDPVTVPSHHGPDVQTIFPDLDIDTLGLKVPATLTHTHSVNVVLDGDATVGDVRTLLESEPRTFLVPRELDIDGSGALKQYALDRGRPRGDLWENCVFGESITVEDGPAGPELYLFQAIHQESDVVPENVDAIRAVTGSADAVESRRRTDEALGMGL